MRSCALLCGLILLGFGPVCLAGAAQPPKGPVKVFLLAGQSNMQGYGHIRTLPWLGEDPTYGHLLKKVRNPDNSWVVRDDVWVYYRSGKKQVKKGNLTVGFGVDDQHIGPELMCGHVLGDHFDNQVLLIKTAWGGRSLAVNFRPPSAGSLPLAVYPKAQSEKLAKAIADKTLVVGLEYQLMVQEVRDVLADLKKHFPAYQGQGYEIAGFVWFQGWNDMIDPKFTAEYSRNLVNLIKDLRKDLKVPNLPAVIGEMGVDGKHPGANIAAFRKAQAEGANHPDFKGMVAFVETAGYWDETAAAVLKAGWKGNKWIDKDLEAKFSRMGSQPEYHYMGSAKIYALIGHGLGEGMKKLCQAQKPAK
jgi:alpha-galactosidase